jgi:hypothetical protein
MSTFTLTIDTDNDAFADGARLAEVAEILRKLAAQIEDDPSPDGCSGGAMRDANGNVVGCWINTVD